MFWVMFMSCFGVLRGIYGCILCQKWLRLSWKVDECKPLPLALEHLPVGVGVGALAVVAALRPGAYTRSRLSST